MRSRSKDSRFAFHSIKPLAVLRKSPKHKSIQKIKELVLSKQSRDVPIAKGENRNEDEKDLKSPVKLKINSFIGGKATEAIQNRKEGIECLKKHVEEINVLSNSTATTTISSRNAHKQIANSQALGKSISHYSFLELSTKEDPHIEYTNPLKASGLKEAKRPIKVPKFTPNRSSFEPGQKKSPIGDAKAVQPQLEVYPLYSKKSEDRSKTPAIRFSMLQQAVNAMEKADPNASRSRQGLSVLHGSNNKRSRNQKALGITECDLIIRTKPDDGNESVLLPQQIQSTRKESREEKGTKSVIKQVTIKVKNTKASQPKTQTRKYCTKQIVMPGPMTEEKPHAENAKLFFEGVPRKLAFLEEQKESEKAPKPVLRQPTAKLNIHSSQAVINRKNDLLSCSYAEEERLKQDKGADDSDDCKTVIENNCENDYSWVCASLSSVDP